MRKVVIILFTLLLIFQAMAIYAWAKPSDKSGGLLLQDDEDVGVSAIVSPAETIVLGVAFPLKSEVTNFEVGSSTFDVVYDIYIQGTSTLILSDTASVIFMPGGTIDTITFNQSFTPSLDTTYQLTSYTILASDIHPANNTSSITTSFVEFFAVWYGNLDGSPVQADIGSRTGVDCFVWCGDDVFVADVHLCLGTNDLYIDSLLSVAEGELFYPFTEWDGAEFVDPHGSPPNPAGWSSQSFIGFARLSSHSEAPWLAVHTPTHVLRYMTKTKNDPLLIGQTVDALGPGENQFQGPSNAGDTVGGAGYPVVEYHSDFYFRGAGHIAGTVTNELAQPVIDILVEDLVSGKVDITDINGYYLLSDLSPGSHDISFSHPNHRDTVVTGVNVIANSTTTLNVQLEPLPFDDVGVSGIISPPQFVQLNTEYPLKSEIVNYGTAISTFDVVFEAYMLASPTPMFVDTVTVVDMVGGTVDTVAFDSTLYTSNDTTYNFISYTILPADVDASNDSATSSSSIFFGVSAWYGNIDSSPLTGYLDDELEVDVYIQTIESIYLSYIHLCLGTDDHSIADHLSQDKGQVYYPFTQWDVALFSSSYGSPPNPEDWSSQSFWGISSIGSQPNPWLHEVIPTKVLTFVVQTVNDPTLVLDTVDCFGAGLNPSLGPSSASDTLISQNYPVIEVFSPVFFKAYGSIAGTVLDEMGYPIEDCYITAIPSSIDDSTDAIGSYFLDSLIVGTYDVLFSHEVYRDTVVAGVSVLNRQVTILDMVMKFPCDYVPGDINGDDIVIGGDITYGVRYLKGIGQPPPDSCYNGYTDEWLYAAADVNGDCIFMGSDIIYLVEYFKGNNPPPQFCPQTPPPSALMVTYIDNKTPLIIPKNSASMEDKK
ncbi:MAG: hypothetical protein J7K40_08860 [candidate division Zixibacteria bacterium]|nr:hypothetical protein [candidate division Zixibacteria bacterium]